MRIIYSEENGFEVFDSPWEWEKEAVGTLTVFKSAENGAQIEVEYEAKVTSNGTVCCWTLAYRYIPWNDGEPIVSEWIFPFFGNLVRGVEFTSNEFLREVGSLVD